MKIIFAAAAFAVCFFIGRRKSAELKARVGFLSEISIMLNNFSAEIRFGSPELSELISRENSGFAVLVRKYEEQCHGDIKAAWEKACEGLSQNAEETRLLSELLPALAAGSSEGAVMTLKLYSERFSRLEAQAREEYSRKGGALKKIGALCGAAAAIMII